MPSPTGHDLNFDASLWYSGVTTLLPSFSEGKFTIAAIIPSPPPSLTVWRLASSLYRNSFSQGHQCLPNCQTQQRVISPNS